ncbi:Hypothetical predicted protein [Olea europaea subsp. europaea]|uniref:Uncharacterized protein n=1 Tax=Olea europaea subsp. europaea TaxID=158383 RepID=A0A8S0U1X1_OLEEU|nr:Hypothetical predicted protein [Olea europaea subsp. europaea]
MQIPQQSKKFIDSGQHQASLNIPEQAFNRSRGFEQQMLNPIQQAYLQYAFQDAQQKPTVGLQSHHQMKPGMFSALGKDQDIRMANIKMQQLMSLHAANHSQPSSSKISCEQSGQVEKADNVKQPMSGQRTELKPDNQPTLLGQVVPAASMQGGPQSQLNIMNMTNNPISAQVQAMQALALVRILEPT